MLFGVAITKIRRVILDGLQIIGLTGTWRSEVWILRRKTFNFCTLDVPASDGKFVTFVLIRSLGILLLSKYMCILPLRDRLFQLPFGYPLLELVLSNTWSEKVTNSS